MTDVDVVGFIKAHTDCIQTLQETVKTQLKAIRMLMERVDRLEKKGV